MAEATSKTETIERTTVTLTMTLEEAEAIAALASKADDVDGPFGKLVRPVYNALDDMICEHDGSSVDRLLDHYRRLDLGYRYGPLL